MEDEHVFTKFLSSLKRKWLLVLLGICGIVLVLVGGNMTNVAKPQSSQTETDSVSLYAASLEKSITDMCSQMEGVGEVSVVVMLEAGDTYTYSGGKPISHQMPRVRGVAVVCDGGNNPVVQANIISMLSALLDIGTHHIYVGAKQ